LDVVLSDPLVRRYRTLLRSELAKGPDFAGHYRVVTIGMGTGLVTVVILDTSTGSILSPRQLESVFFPLPNDDERSEQYGLAHRLDSRLLVVRGIPASVEAVGTYFFQLSADRLVFVRGFRWPSAAN